MRGFEVVSDKYRKHEGEIILPKRGTMNSAGYDITLPCTVVLKPNERVLVFTDIKAHMLQDEVLYIYVRSSLGVKKGIILSNGTGVIDSDYYSNIDNDGNIGLPLWNTSDKVVVLEAGERVAQGIFMKYLVTHDDEVNSVRAGGFGSTKN